MATYVTLIKLTQRGVKDIKDTCKRAAELKAHAKKHGIEVKEQYWCMGAYDGVIIFDAPDDAIAARFTLMLGRLGNVRTVTMKAFPEEAYRQIINSFQ